jgi:hypothetical protein
MSEWTRVKDKRTGAHISVPRVNKEHHEVLNPNTHPATDRNGQPLPDKPAADLSAKKKEGSS